LFLQSPCCRLDWRTYSLNFSKCGFSHTSVGVGGLDVGVDSERAACVSVVVAAGVGSVHEAAWPGVVTLRPATLEKSGMPR
jgi:hypothetical protein